MPFAFIAQPEFSFDLYFEDALGNRDTITLGYDPLATDGIDAQFGEENIISQPWDSVFEVRIGDKTSSFLYGYPENETFSTKKQIIKKQCDSNWSIWDLIYIDLKNPNFPVTVSWNNNVFDSDCIKGSILQSEEINSWLDVGNFDGYLSRNPGFINLFESSITYQNTDNSISHSYWFMFGDNKLLTLNNTILNYTEISISPNPFSEVFKINKEHPISKIKFLDMQGKEISFVQNENNIEFINASRGEYIMIYETNKKLNFYRLHKN